MKYTILTSLLASALVAAPAFAADAAKAAPAASKPAATTTTANLTTDAAKISYVFGLNMGMNLHSQQIAIDPNVFLQGLKTGLAGEAPAMTPAQVQEVLTNFQKNMMAKQAAEYKKDAEQNLKAGEEFMKKFLAEKDARKVNDDIAYKVITAGSGALPKLTDTVTMTYEGKLVDGKVFDSTKRNGDKPISLSLQQMIPGMQKIITMMPVGSTWEVILSPKVAYGDKGVPMSPIGPNETLDFIITIKSAAPTVAPAAAK